jgi:hypothetical protein
VGVEGPEDGVVHPPAGLWGGNVLGDFAYAQERLTSIGELLYRLMRLGDIPDSEQLAWLDELRGT